MLFVVEVLPVLWEVPVELDPSGIVGELELPPPPPPQETKTIINVFELMISF